MSCPRLCRCESVEAGLLREALVDLALAAEYANRQDLDQLTIDAICMRLSAGIEVLSQLDADTRAGLFNNNWQLMWGMRNRIAHGYLLVDSDIVRKTIEVDLPDICQTIKQALRDSGSQS